MSSKRPGAAIQDAASGPEYQLRSLRHGPADHELEVWQLPSAATPNLPAARRVAGLRGRNLALVEHRVAKRLKQAGVASSALAVGESGRDRLNEDVALMLGLLFRTLAPMRDRDNMLACAAGIEVMAREEAAYWLGMAMHRRNPRRILTALRYLLTDPKHKPRG